MRTFIKPDLTFYFSAMPLIGMYLKADYDNANTNKELVNVMHSWFNKAEQTANSVKKQHYEASARYLYSFLTGKSFESKDCGIIS